MVHHLDSFTEAQLEQYDVIRAGVVKHNGYTSQVFTSGFMVSLPATETQVPVSGLDTEIFYRLCNLYEDWAVYHQCNWGIWLNDGKLYFDLSVNIPELDKALEVGVANQQLAIWDCANSQCISLVDGLE